MEVTLQAAKKTLRVELKSKLKSMPWKEKCLQSEFVAKKLFTNKKFQESTRVSVYLSRDIEISTDVILTELFRSRKQCFIPKYQTPSSVMKMVKLYSVEDYNNLPRTRWNIKQPSDDDNDREDAMITGGLDLMIVPGIGFTKAGHRIGNGKGYYDVYIKNYNKTFEKPVYTIGLAFREQVVSDIPTGEHDVTLNEVIVGD